MALHMCAVSIMKNYYLYFGNMSRICGNFTVEKYKLIGRHCTLIGQYGYKV